MRGCPNVGQTRSESVPLLYSHVLAQHKFSGDIKQVLSTITQLLNCDSFSVISILVHVAWLSLVIVFLEHVNFNTNIET